MGVDFDKSGESVSKRKHQLIPNERSRLKNALRMVLLVLPVGLTIPFKVTKRYCYKLDTVSEGIPECAQSQYQAPEEDSERSEEKFVVYKMDEYGRETQMMVSEDSTEPSANCCDSDKVNSLEDTGSGDNRYTEKKHCHGHETQSQNELVQNHSNNWY